MFSVIMPAYNCEKTIRQALDSVINQTRFDLIEEIIIINDGSTDNTDCVIRSYIKEMEEIGKVKIIYEVQENYGVSYTRNKAIAMAKGEWIALIDSDDIWFANKLERQLYFLKSNKDIVFMGADHKLIFGNKQKKGLYKISAKELCIKSTPVTPSVIFKKAVGQELGLFNEQMRYGEDINFYQKFLLKDSYYVLMEKLVEIGIGKEYFAQSGLTSDLYKMHLGRRKNTKELYEMGLISKPYECVMQFLNELKYLRRKLIGQVKK